MLDEQVKSVLLAGGHATANAVDAWEQAASSGASSLYEVALCSGTVDERALVSDLSAQLGVPSVSLVSFKGKPELLELVPRWMVEQLRALPIGLKEREGKLTLFVAMEDPLDVDALEAIAGQVSHPVVALLAGPTDLRYAMKRVFGVAPPPPGSEPPAHPVPPPPERDTLPARPMASQLPEASSQLGDSGAPLFGSFADLGTSDASAALAMLDDIPRDRHVVDTSPSGFISIPDLVDSVLPDPAADSSVELLAMATEDLEDLDGFELAESALSILDAVPTDVTGLDLAPNAPRQPGAPEPGASGLEWQDYDTHRLVRAVVTILLRRGLVTTRELAELARD